jgi:hypothetical protein
MLAIKRTIAVEQLCPQSTCKKNCGCFHSQIIATWIQRYKTLPVHSFSKPSFFNQHVKKELVLRKTYPLSYTSLKIMRGETGTATNWRKFLRKISCTERCSGIVCRVVKVGTVRFSHSDSSAPSGGDWSEWRVGRKKTYSYIRALTPIACMSRNRQTA